MALQDWLEGVYREQAPALFRFLFRLTGDEGEVREVIQEIFVRLAKAPRLLDGVTAPRSFLFRMAHRMVIDRHRRDATRQHYDDRVYQEQAAVVEPALVAEDAVWRQKLLAASLEALPPEQKAVVVLKVWEEMTFAEIADVLEIPANTAASRYRYALDKLRDELRPLYKDLR